MSKLSRTKGRAFEQRIARELREAMPSATVRRSLQAHRAYEPDLVIEGDAPIIATWLWLELTDSRAPSPLDKLAQAERDIDAAGDPERVPVVVWHKTGAKSIQSTMRLRSLTALVGGVTLTGARGWLDTPVTVDWEHVLGRLRQLAAAQLVTVT